MESYGIVIVCIFYTFVPFNFGSQAVLSEGLSQCLFKIIKSEFPKTLAALTQIGPEPFPDNNYAYGSFQP